MKVTFKDLKQNKFTLDIEPTDLISAVKQKISEEKGWDAKQQKLIYSGKILKDDETVESYKIEEKGFVVCMVNKPKEPKPAASAASSSTANVPSTPAQPVASTPAAPPAPAAQPSTQAAVPSTPTPARSAAPPADTPASFNDPSALTLGVDREAAIANLEAMGFERSQVEAAMRAAYFNPDRAVEYLLNGIPEGLAQERRAPAAPAASAPAAEPAAAPQAGGGDEGSVNLFDLAAAQQGGGGSTARSGGEAAPAAGAQQGFGNLDFLRNNPQFQQLRQVVQQQPQMLEPILEQLGEDADDDAPLPPGAQAISVTEEERDAIERLCRLGFSREEAAQAYFACDKNEELAANFLFDQPDNDDGAQ
ncbi:unnamed protein product [Parascedosporium putredinis]|uniref:UV excision repair protein RAD23 n=1 Tax=Parascedosporium putredinis TaxID=1442378 RepID=A0A9P1MDR1_9PEZI|nr:unnamed protein product [Parascedosporium putredinis]CAI8000113.1 unnamed protein product [Parascedosporium putredinis]